MGYFLCSEPHLPFILLSKSKDKQKNKQTMDSSTLRCEHEDRSSISPSGAQTKAESPTKDTTIRAKDDDNSSEEDDVSSDDEHDDWASPLLVDAVKTALYHLLDDILNLYRTDECNGCKTNHPSQRPRVHSLWVLEDYFYADHYYSIRKKLITPRFIPFIKRFLFDREIEASDAKVGIVADTLLHELKSERKILDAISDSYKKLVGEDAVKHGQLEMVLKCYKSNHWFIV